MGIVDVSLGANQSASGMVGVGTGDCGPIGGVVALIPRASRGRFGGGGTDGDGDGNGGGVGGTDAATLGPGDGNGDDTGVLDATGSVVAVGEGAALDSGSALVASEAIAFAALLQMMRMPAQAR